MLCSSPTREDDSSDVFSDYTGKPYHKCSSCSDLGDVDTVYWSSKCDRSCSSIAGTADSEDLETDCASCSEDESPDVEELVFHELLRSGASDAQPVRKSESPIRATMQIALLDDLIYGFQGLEFQLRMQQLLLTARSCGKRNSDKLRQLNGVGSELQRLIHHGILPNTYNSSSESKHSESPVWDFFAPVSENIEVTKRFSEIDELLALPRGSTSKVLRNCSRGNTNDLFRLAETALLIFCGLHLTSISVIQP